MKAIITLSVALGLCGCASSLTFEPDKTGAENECSRTSPTLAEYNACMERVDALYRDYELHRKLSGKDDG
jgi:hypothetical protein